MHVMRSVVYNISGFCEHTHTSTIYSFPNLTLKLILFDNFAPRYLNSGIF
jgi:hypothetical protein